MVKEFRPVPGQEGTVQSLARKALALLKLVEQIIAMDEPRLQPQVEEAKESVEDLILSLEDTQKVAVANYEVELAKLEQEVQETDWSKYQQRPSR
jgi:biopolymer transport protein ExbD